MNASHNRRAFLRATGSSLALAAAGCDGPLHRASRLIFGSAEISPFKPPQSDALDLVSHALSRMTWGAGPGDYQRVAAMGADPAEAVKNFLAEQLAAPPPSEDHSEAARRVRALEELHLPLGEFYEHDPRELNFSLSRAALLRATYSPWQLYEVMVGFWTDHFNIDSSKADCRWLKAWDDREVIRRHALGNFRDLLRASALSPAMLFYLDGRENRRRNPEEKPNENYARELLELHTLGVHGGYSQDDVMEVARCLTGWTVRGRDNGRARLADLAEALRSITTQAMSDQPTNRIGIGRVEFIAKNHDEGAKTVLGKKIPAGLGAKDLDEVLKLVAEHPSTAKFVATKLCRRFIADDPPEAAITATAAAFTASNGDIKKTLTALFATKEFLEARSTKLKRPFHFLVSALRAVGAESKCGVQVQQYLRRMGHMPFDYPTPEGYSDQGSDWHSTLLARWDFALRLTRGELADSEVKLDRLAKAAGGEESLTQHLLGRRATTEERTLLEGAGSDQVALVLTSPAFQKY